MAHASPSLLAASWTLSAPYAFPVRYLMPRVYCCPPGLQCWEAVISLAWFCSPTYLLQPQPSWQEALSPLTRCLRCSAAVKAPDYLPGAAVPLAPCAAHLHPKPFWGGAGCATSVGFTSLCTYVKLASHTSSKAPCPCHCSLWQIESDPTSTLTQPPAKTVFFLVPSCRPAHCPSTSQSPTAGGGSN